MRGFTWSINASTGVFSGAFQTQATTSIAIFPPPPPVRITFFGLVVPSQGSGVGMFTDNVTTTSGSMR